MDHYGHSIRKFFKEHLCSDNSSLPPALLRPLPVPWGPPGAVRAQRWVRFWPCAEGKARD